MQAIITKYLPATNFKGSRIKASCDRGSITVSYDSAQSEQGVHVYAADQLIARFVAEDAKRYGTERNPWSKPRCVGQIPSGEYVHVFQS
jgi:hypothetical protein